MLLCYEPYKQTQGSLELEDRRSLLYHFTNDANFSLLQSSRKEFRKVCTHKRAEVNSTLQPLIFSMGACFIVSSHQLEFADASDKVQHFSPEQQFIVLYNEARMQTITELDAFQPEQSSLHHAFSIYDLQEYFARSCFDLLILFSQSTTPQKRGRRTVM